MLQSFLTLHERGYIYGLMSSLFDIEYERKLLQAQEAREREEELQEAIKEIINKALKEVSDKVAMETKKLSSEAIAKNLLQLGKLSIEEISQVTWLSIEEVEAL